MKDLIHNKDIYRRATFLMQVLLHINNFFRTDTFSTKVLLQKRHFFRTATLLEKLFFHESNIPHYLLFLESHISERIRPNFPQQVLFQKNYFSKHTFSEKILFHSYVSSLQVTPCRLGQIF